MRIHDLRDLVADRLAMHAGREDDMPALTVISPTQPRFPRAPRPKLVSDYADGKRVWMWTVGQLRRLLPVLEAAVAEHEAMHTFDLPDLAAPRGGGDGD